MSVMVIVKASKTSESGAMPDGKILTEMGRFNEELANASILVAAEGLHPRSKGFRVEFSGALFQRCPSAVMGVVLLTNRGYN